MTCPTGQGCNVAARPRPGPRLVAVGPAVNGVMTVRRARASSSVSPAAGYVAPAGDPANATQTGGSAFDWNAFAGHALDEFGNLVEHGIDAASGQGSTSQQTQAYLDAMQQALASQKQLQQFPGPQPPPPAPSGLSTGEKWGLGLGLTAVAVGGYALMKGWR